MRRQLLIGFILANLLACNGLDQDDAFLYSHRFTFLLNDSSKVFQVVSVNDTNLEARLFLEGVQDGALLDETAHFLDTTHSKLLSYPKPFDKVYERALGQAYNVVGGWEDFEVFSNSYETLVEFKKGDKTSSVRLPNGGEHVFCNQGRLWLVQKRKVWVYDLRAGAVIDTFRLERDFQFADYDQGKMLFVYTKDSTGLYQKYFDTNAVAGGTETPVNFQKIQHTKVLTRLYETEYLQDVVLNSQNRLNIPSFNELVDSYDMDFQSSRLFYTRHDSLFVYFVNFQKVQFLGAGFGNIRKGMHFYSP